MGCPAARGDGEGEEMKVLRVTMLDGSEWDIPLERIARNRAENYADEFDGDVERSLREDTMPLFEQDSFEASDWAANNMNWDEVEDVAVCYRKAPTPDFQEGWVNGEKEVVEKCPPTPVAGPCSWRGWCGQELGWGDERLD